MTQTDAKGRRMSETVHYTSEDRERLGRLEGDVAHLQHGFGELRNEVTKGFDRLANELNRQGEKVEQKSQTNWGVVIAAVSALAMIVGMGSGVVVMYVDNMVRPQEMTTDYLASHIGLVQSHAEAIGQERMATLNERLDAAELRIATNEATIGERGESLVVIRERLTRMEAQQGRP